MNIKNLLIIQKGKTSSVNKNAYANANETEITKKLIIYLISKTEKT